MDLYRLQATSQDDFAPLQLGRVFDECKLNFYFCFLLRSLERLFSSFLCSGISLIEWPSRLADFRNLLPSSRNRLHVYIDNVAQTNTRRVQLVAQTGSTWIERLQTLVSQGLLDDLILPETRKS
jgi:tRNA A37 threonylcarbamoyladenosine biosynthesis protein TsaE